MAQFASTLYPQTNPTNPILLEFRGRDWYYANIWDEAAWWLGSLEQYATEGHASLSQVDHARRVLTRLASFSG